MATSKKTTGKKAATTKKAPVKKASATKKTSVKKAPKMRSFHISADTPPFTTFKITRQTVYWVILVSFIIFMQLWILKLQLETSILIQDQLTSINDNISPSK